jgi:hypothetical protein
VWRRWGRRGGRRTRAGPSAGTAPPPHTCSVSVSQEIGLGTGGPGATLNGRFVGELGGIEPQWVLCTRAPLRWQKAQRTSCPAAKMLSPHPYPDSSVPLVRLRLLHGHEASAVVGSVHGELPGPSPVEAAGRERRARRDRRVVLLTHQRRRGTAVVCQGGLAFRHTYPGLCIYQPVVANSPRRRGTAVVCQGGEGGRGLAFRHTYPGLCIYQPVVANSPRRRGTAVVCWRRGRIGVYGLCTLAIGLSQPTVEKHGCSLPGWGAGKSSLLCGLATGLCTESFWKWRQRSLDRPLSSIQASV